MAIKIEMAKLAVAAQHYNGQIEIIYSLPSHRVSPPRLQALHTAVARRKGKSAH